MDNIDTNEAENETNACYICSFKTNCLDDYNGHIISSHNQLCDVCDYSTTTLELLQEHGQIHKNVTSNECDLETVDDVSLKEHNQNRHEEHEAGLSVNELLVRTPSQKRKENANHEKDKRIRIHSSIRESSPDMFASDNDSDKSSSEQESLENCGEEDPGSEIETKVYKVKDHDVSKINNFDLNGCKC